VRTCMAGAYLFCNASPQEDSIESKRREEADCTKDMKRDQPDT